MQVHWTVTIVYRARVAKLCQESAVDAYLRHSMQAFTCAFLGTCVWPFTFHSPSLFRSPLSTLTSLSHTHAYTHVTHLIQYQWMNNSISLCILINFIFLLLFYIVSFVYFFLFFLPLYLFNCGTQPFFSSCLHVIPSAWCMNRTCQWAK